MLQGDRPAHGRTAFERRTVQDEVREEVGPVESRTEDISMKLIYLNRWGIIFHAILTTFTEDEDRVLASRVCTSLEEARRLIEGWQAQHGIADNDIRDHYCPVICRTTTTV